MARRQPSHTLKQNKMLEPNTRNATKENVEELIIAYKVWYHDRMSMYIKSEAEVKRAEEMLIKLESLKNNK